MRPPRVRAVLLLTSALLSATLHAVDLPSITAEHLYYLRARALRLQDAKAEEMLDYCVAMKIGGPVFDSLYAQLLWHRNELARVTKVDILPASDPYVRWLNKSFDACNALLKEEVLRVQAGLLKEGTVALDTLEMISKAQAQMQSAQPTPPEK